MKKKTAVEYNVYVIKDDNCRIIDETTYYKMPYNNSKVKKIKLLVFCNFIGKDVLYGGTKVNEYIRQKIPALNFQQLYPVDVVNKLEEEIGDNQGVLLCCGNKEVFKLFNKEEEIVNHFGEWLKELLIRI